MASELTPIFFAKTLGLVSSSDPGAVKTGLWALLAPSRAEEAKSLVHQTLSRTHSELGRDQERRANFDHIVARDFLPSLLELYRSLPDHLVPTAAFRLLSSFVYLSLLTPLGTRYLRERSEEAQILRTKVLERIITYARSTVTPAEAVNFLTVIPRLFSHLTRNLPYNLPDKGRLSMLPPTFLDHLRTSLASLLALTKHEWEETSQSTKGYLRILSSSLEYEGDVDHIEWRVTRIGHWWSCGAKWDQVSVDVYPAAESPCSVGKDMDACSGCLSVRYCCREHQRAHWKRHKPFCQPPNW